MHQRTSILAIFLLVSAVLGCSLLRSRGPVTWHITLQIDPATPNLEQVVNETIQVIDSRLNAVGAFGSSRAEQNGRIRVDLPNVADRERLKNLLTAKGKLELVHVISPPSPAPAQTFATEAEAVQSLGGANRKVLPYFDRSEPTAPETTNQNASKATKYVVVEMPPIIDGADLRNATAIPARSGETVDYDINFSLKKEGADKFGAWTGANINEYMGVVLNDHVRSIAFIKSQIFDSGLISGRFTKESAEDLALILRSGALPAAVKIVEEGSN